MKITATLFFLTACAFGQLTGEARLLKEKRDAKVKEIDALYAAELAKIQKKVMADGKLDAANAIQKEIAGAATYTLVNPIVGKWKWNTITAEITPDGKAIADGHSGVWVENKLTTNEREYTVTWNGGKVIDSVVIVRDGKKGSAKNSYGQAFTIVKLNTSE